MKLSAVIAIWIVAVAEAAVVPTKHREILAKNSPLHNRKFPESDVCGILHIGSSHAQAAGLWLPGIRVFMGRRYSASFFLRAHFSSVLLLQVSSMRRRASMTAKRDSEASQSPFSQGVSEL